MSRTEYKAVIFDLDGTLIDTIRDIGEAVNYALKQQGITPLTTEEHSRNAGWGLRVSLERALPGKSRDFIDRAFPDLMEYYSLNPCVYTQPYDGIRELLDTLQKEGVKLFVYTNKAETIAKSIVNKLFGKNCFTDVFGTVDRRPLKPHKEGIEYVIGKTGLDKREILYVGDSEVDMETAAAGELDCFAVTWGFRTPEQLASYPKKDIVNFPDEIAALILRDPIADSL